MVIINMLFNSTNLTYFTLQDDVNIGDEVFRGTLTVVSADNLASQLIGGYKALNSAFRKCRYCMPQMNRSKQDWHICIIGTVNFVSCL